MRNYFLVSGILFLLFGGELLAVDKFVLNGGSKSPSKGFSFASLMSKSPTQPAKVIDPPDTLCYTVLSTGFITLMYSFILPKKQPKPKP